MIIIGSSTGGPRVLFEIFTDLPILDASIVIVQHMPLPSNIRMARRLGQLCQMDVRIPETNTPVKERTVYIAKSEQHLVLKNNQLFILTDSEKVNFVRPSIDITMMSVLPEPGTAIAGIVLSGMGSDGAAGITHIKKIGGVTAVQDPATCTVKSMPEAAILTEKVDLVLTPAQIKEFLISF